MKLNLFSILALATSVAAHATWQELWVDGVDEGGTCDRLPINNSPIGTTDPDVRCGTGSPVAGICTVEAGGTVTIEMHQQPVDRSCSNEAIGGSHNGPVIAYLAKVDDATTDPGTSWFKIFQNGLVSTNPNIWATDVLNSNCGKQIVVIPTDIEPGDYLLRAEVIALHVAGSLGGAQHYVSCYQLKITGGGSAEPSGVSFPGAYSPTDPGILFDLYGSYTTYIIPGPTVYTAGSGSGGGSPTTVTSTTKTTATTNTITVPTTTTAPTTTSASGGGTLAKYSQCGGNGWTGSGTCVAGTICTKLNDFYSQCL
ncbi:glycosyl hydrolase family 61-domain-containing protein [Sphaerosporella brunnea]|uniref:AA9 family lytic polysaccharide monooxygenase n=1 Tax=Sphaerosporella brunnea TaxID=1250544 RepID=A0A5J5ESK4_9PEZI|nr:glycosyl hydrolase family 61-domain-containing protein [Sphaerosporella brunnea]